MHPIGYVMLQHSVRLDRPAIAYGKWIARIPAYYRKYVLDSPSSRRPKWKTRALLRDVETLSQPDAHGPRGSQANVFLKPSDGAIEPHANAVPEAYADFQWLARKIGERSGITLE